MRALENREVTPVGADQPVAIDVRLLAATNVDLQQAVEQHEFREDLYYRLNVIPLEIPPLRQRLDDIPLLAQHILEKLTRRKV